MGNRLSVVIQSHQPTLVLGRCLEAVLTQRCDEELEVVVVDHCARRSVHQLIRWWNLSLARQGRRHRVLHVPVRTASTDGDRLGVRASTGSSITFLDETARPSRDWVAGSVGELELRESLRLDITPLLQAHGVVERRATLMSAMAIDDRAVLSAHASASELFNRHQEGTKPSEQAPLASQRVATVTRIERAGRKRFAPIEDYVCLVALLLAATAALLQNYAIAAFALSIWVVLTAFAVRSNSRRTFRHVVTRPFSKVWRGMLTLRSQR